MEGHNPDSITETYEIKVNNLDTTITEEVKKLKESEEPIITDIKKINENIKSKHDQYKRSITKEGETFKTKLQKKYNLFFQRAGSIKDSFVSVLSRLSNSQYFAVIVLFISIIFFITHLPSISDIFQDPLINGIIPALLAIIIIWFIIFTRETIIKIRQIDPDPIKNLTSDLNNIEFDEVKTYDYEDDIEEQKRCTNQLVSSAQSAVDIVLSKVPLYKEYNEDDHFRRKWELGCDEYQNALKFFGLYYKSQFYQLKDRPNIHAKRADESVFDRTILREISRILNIPAEIIEMYIQYYRGENTRILWDEIKKDPNNTITISKNLFNSNQIDIDRSRLSEDEFQQIVVNTKEFSISQLSKNSSLYAQIKLKLANYEKILIENEVPLSNKENNLINLINFNLSFEENFLHVLSEKIEYILPKTNSLAYKNAIIAILLNDEILFKDKVCRNAAEDETIFVLMTYHELLRERKENNQLFKLNDLLINLNSLESTKERIQKDIELQNRFNYFKNDLSRGYWWDDGLSLQRKMFDDLKRDFSQKIETLDRSIIITKLLEKTFTEININTVDKAIDANLFSTYLILTTSRRGHLLEFLDPISIRNLDWTKKDLMELKIYEKKYGITLIKDGKPKYDFTNYSTRTRIGVLPRNTIFLDFVQEMKTDINKILQAESQTLEGEMEDIGLAIIRVTPSKYSFGLLDDEIEKYCNVRTRDLHIAKIIAVLARDYTSNSEQYLMSAFDGKINLTEIFNQMSILELIPAKGMDISSDYERFLRSDSLKKAILSSLAKEGISNIKGLSKTVRSGRENYDKLESIIREAIVDEYFERNEGILIQSSRLNLLMNELMKSLVSIAYLMENIS
jgi:hypothetical protein